MTLINSVRIPSQPTSAHQRQQTLDLQQQSQMQRVGAMQRYQQMQMQCPPSPPLSAKENNNNNNNNTIGASFDKFGTTAATATTTTPMTTPTSIGHGAGLIVMKSESKVCYRCELTINDPFVIDVGGYPWHAECLRCCVCTTALGEHQTCFLRRNKVYCKEDYLKTFIAHCAKCCREISPSDWVRKARDAVYHLACFSCDTCDRQLSTGEQFAMLSDQILCREHYMETMEIETGSSDDSVGSEKKSKRVRTAFTEEQLEVLNRSFEIDNNPDGQDLERIALSAGLSKRVTQVWFQNSRARQKKHSYQHKRNRPSPYDLNVQLQPNMVY